MGILIELFEVVVGDSSQIVMPNKPNTFLSKNVDWDV